MRKAGRAKRCALRLLGYLLSVCPPLFATLSFFPIWKARGGAAVLAGGTVLLLVLCALPLLRGIRAMLKSPSVWGMWLFAFLSFLLIGSIVHEMRVICLFGFLGNLLGSLLFLLAGRIGDENGS